LLLPQPVLLLLIELTVLILSTLLEIIVESPLWGPNMRIGIVTIDGIVIIHTDTTDTIPTTAIIVGTDGNKEERS
jgi:hypothetical protein